MSAPDSKYQMMWGGKYCPVTNMYDMFKVPTTLPHRARIVVLYVADDEWVTTTTDPGDIVRRDGWAPTGDEWDVI